MSGEGNKIGKLLGEVDNLQKKVYGNEITQIALSGNYVFVLTNNGKLKKKECYGNLEWENIKTPVDILNDKINANIVEVRRLKEKMDG